MNGELDPKMGTRQYPITDNFNYPHRGILTLMTPQEIGEQVLEAMSRRGLSQEALAELVGVGQSTISRIIKGEFKRMPSEMLAICTVLDLPIPELDGKRAQRSIGPLLPAHAIIGTRDFPVYASAEGGNGEIIRSIEPIDFIPRPGPVAHVKEAYGLLITGTSMVPEYKPGETALVNPKLPIVAEEVYIFYAELHGEARASIKHLRRPTEKTWLVSQHNPPREFSLDRREWQWVHRVFGKHTRV